MAHSKPLFELCLICMQLWCLEGFGVTLHKQGCAAHAMDLLLEDWGKATWIKETVEKAKLLVKFVKKRHMPLTVFRKYEAKFSLLMPEVTRFASHFIMIDRLLNVKEELEQTVVDPQWTAYISKRSCDGRDKAQTARTIKTVVLNKHFWDCCTNFQEMIAPVVAHLSLRSARNTMGTRGTPK